MRREIFLSFLIMALLIAGCTNEASKSEAQSDSVARNTQSSFEPLKGTSLSPKSFASSDFTGFFARAKEAGNAVMWAGDWNELINTQSGAPAVMSALADNYKLTPVVEAQFFTQSTGKLIRPLDAATKENYRKSAAAFAETFKPKYMGFGVEVNMLYEKSPADFDAFAQFYGEVYDAVKEKSPGTKVFTVFQLEKMKGMNGGLFGGTNDPAKAEWFLLDKFPESDIAAFTTYPSLVYDKPSDIPTDYYSEIKSRTSKPIAFTEIGWHSAASPKGWESNESEQAEFVGTFFNLTKSLEPEIVVWAFMYDQNTIEPFNSMGLLGSDGSEKAAWGKWVRE